MLQKQKLFQNIYSQTYLEKTHQTKKQRETHKKQPPKPNQQLFTPQKALLHSHRPALIQKLTHVALRVGSSCAQAHSRVRRAQGSGSTELPSQGTQPHLSGLFCGLGVKHLQEEPLAAANVPTSQNTRWKSLGVLAPILLLSC